MKDPKFDSINVVTKYIHNTTATWQNLNLESTFRCSYGQNYQYLWSSRFLEQLLCL